MVGLFEAFGQVTEDVFEPSRVDLLIQGLLILRKEPCKVRRHLERGRLFWELSLVFGVNQEVSARRFIAGRGRSRGSRLGRLLCIKGQIHSCRGQFTGRCRVLTTGWRCARCLRTCTGATHSVCIEVVPSGLAHLRVVELVPLGLLFVPDVRPEVSERCTALMNAHRMQMVPDTLEVFLFVDTGDLVLDLIDTAFQLVYLGLSLAYPLAQTLVDQLQVFWTIALLDAGEDVTGRVVSLSKVEHTFEHFVQRQTLLVRLSVLIFVDALEEDEDLFSWSSKPTNY